MLSFRQFIEESGHYYYHGTSPESAQEIDQHGLKLSSLDSKIYLTRSHIEANKYSKIRSKGRIGVIYQIHSSALKPEHIMSDYSGIVQYGANIPKQHIKKMGI